MKHKLALQGRISRAEVIDAEGNVTASYEGFPNLILNQGMDSIPTTFICDLFLWAAKGTGTLATKVAGSVNISQSGNVVTAASGTPFSSGLVGEYIVGGAAGAILGNIVGFTDSTHITIDGPSQTVAGGSYNLYAVNQTALVAEAGPRTEFYSPTTGDNITTTSGNVRTLQRTFIFNSETASTTYNEVGFANIGTAGANLNIRVDISGGGGILVPILQRLKLTYTLTITVTPNTSTAIDLATLITDSGNVMSTNKNANWIVETFATSRIATNGQTDSTLAQLEPNAVQNMALSSDTTALVFNGNTIRNLNVGYVPLSVVGSYTPGSFIQNFTGIFDITDVNRSDLWSLMLYDPNSGSAIVTYLFAVHQTKDSNHALSLNWAFVWGRTLT